MPPFSKRPASIDMLLFTRLNSFSFLPALICLPLTAAVARQQITLAHACVMFTSQQHFDIHLELKFHALQK